MVSVRFFPQDPRSLTDEVLILFVITSESSNGCFSGYE